MIHILWSMISLCGSLSPPSEETLERGRERGYAYIYTHIIAQADTYLLIHSYVHAYLLEIQCEESQVFCIVYQIFMKVFFLSFLDEVFSTFWNQVLFSQWTVILSEKVQTIGMMLCTSVVESLIGIVGSSCWQAYFSVFFSAVNKFDSSLSLTMYHWNNPISHINKLKKWKSS